MSGEVTHDMLAPARGAGCRLCPENLVGRIVAELDSVWAVKDRYPVSEGHLLVIPKRHSDDWFGMSPDEKQDADVLIDHLRSTLLASDGTITGFNIGMNCGVSAGQTLFHAHIHLIPRRDGDTADPTGGVRGVIPGKMSYPRADGPTDPDLLPS